MKLNKVYKTKNGSSVKLIRKLRDYYIGEIQETKKQIKYLPDGSVFGWSFGNILDIPGIEVEAEEIKKAEPILEEKPKLRTYKEVQELIKSTSSIDNNTKESPVEKASKT